MNRHRTIVLLTAILMLIFSVLASYGSYRHERENEMQQSDLTSKIYVGRLTRDFDRGIIIAESLERIIVDNGGKINDFYEASAGLMESFVSSIQIAPKGKVTHIFPMKGNESGLIDLMEDETRGPIVRYGINNDVVTMQGPFQLKQGGQGIAVRKPVFLNGDDGQRRFWGLTIVIIKVPEIYNKTLDELVSQGYDYSLETTISPLSNEEKFVSGTITEDAQVKHGVAQRFEVGQCKWSLTISQKHVTEGRAFVITVIASLTLSLLVTYLVHLVINLYEKQLRIREISVKDQLTGLLNRRGYVDKVENLLAASAQRQMTAIFLDIDDFKLINDIYGHDIGDEALKNLAKDLRNSFPESTIIGRTGGDEFSVLILDRAPEVSRKLIEEAVRAPHGFEAEDRLYSYTISAGYVFYPQQARTRVQLMLLSDEALYAAKLRGKNNCMQYTEEMSNIKRSQIGFSSKKILEGIPGSLLIYKDSAEKEILFANDALVRLAECKDLSALLRYTKSSFDGFVLEEDRGLVLEIEQRQRDNRGSDPDEKRDWQTANYRIETKDGRSRKIVERRKIISDDNFGDVFFVFINEV